MGEKLFDAQKFNADCEETQLGKDVMPKEEKMKGNVNKIIKGGQ